jgi:hypothetical protein
VTSIAQIASLHTMQAPESSLNFGFRSNPRACYKAIEMEVIDRQADEDHLGHRVFLMSFWTLENCSRAQLHPHDV